MKINEYFTLLASLEYNMQEMYRVQKLADDLVDITVTVTTDSLVYLRWLEKQFPALYKTCPTHSIKNLSNYWAFV